MKSLNRVVVTGLLGLALATGAVAQGQSAGHVPLAKPPFPLLDLPEAKSSGQRAIDLLGDRLPEVAAWYRKSPDELRALLRNDRLVKVDRRGRLFVEDEITQPLPAPPSPAESSALTGTLLPLDQTFLLHSKPGANRTIYLNFRGATISNTAWSSSTLIAQPFDLDGTPGTFSTAELQRIQYIWQRVVEDYAPFDVDVTTEPPPADRLTRSGSGDLVFGTTVVITHNSGVYSCSCGGVAYLGVFDDTSDFYKPALVFYNMLSSGEKNIAEAISHEAGHNMGLSHDGTASTGYYTGHGSGATGWAPIMGVGYYQPLVQWSKGEYSGANNAQDDYTVMQSNGLPLRADDHGNTTATATALAGTTSGGVSSLSATGIVERPSDVDVFSFVASAGTTTVTLSPAARSANLDASIELRDAAGTLLASANPVDAISASLTFALPAAGTYYVSVRGVGKGDPLTTGYTNYGSLGQYSLAVTAPATNGTPPVAVISATPTSGTAPLAVSFNGASSTDPDGSVTGWQWTFGDGGTASGVTASRTYAAGTYVAELTVTDNSGLTSKQTVTITAQAPVVAATMSVADIAMSSRVQKNGSARATAVVSVRDSGGNPVPGATVSGSWSGIVSGTGGALTGSDGKATLSSPQTRSTSGIFVFTVNGVTLAGYAYNPAGNVETSDSIAR